MGRAFEKRKHKMFSRYDKMAKAFTKVGREIAIAVKAGGPEPEYNPRLRSAILNAKGLNMPKDRIDGAIKRASSKDEGNYDETVVVGILSSAAFFTLMCLSSRPFAILPKSS